MWEAQLVEAQLPDLPLPLIGLAVGVLGKGIHNLSKLLLGELMGFVFYRRLVIKPVYEVKVTVQGGHAVHPVAVRKIAQHLQIAGGVKEKFIFCGIEPYVFQ